MVDGTGQKSMQEAIEDFMRHCKLKNLSAATQEYYREDLEYFMRVMQIKYISEFSREIMDNFVDHEMNKGISLWIDSTPILKHVTFLVHVLKSQ